MFREDIPLNQTFTEGDTYAGPSSRQLSICSYELDQINNYFCNVLQPKQSVISRLEEIAQAEKRLVAWRDSVPAEFRPDSILVMPERYTHVLLLHLDYSNLPRATQLAAITMRPALGNYTERLPRRLQASKVLCVEAARSFVKSLNK